MTVSSPNISGCPSWRVGPGRANADPVSLLHSVRDRLGRRACLGRRPVGSGVGRAERGGLAGAPTRARLARREGPQGLQTQAAIGWWGPSCPSALLEVLGLSLGRHLWAAPPCLGWQDSILAPPGPRE